MKTALLALSAWLAFASAPALAAPQRLDLSCQSQGQPAGFHGGVRVHGTSFDRAAEVGDNYMSGRAVCETLHTDESNAARETILCSGLWRSWSRDGERLEILIELDGSDATATFKRSRVYGGAEVTIPCRVSSS